MKWEIALKMVGLLHVLILQNRYLRGLAGAFVPSLRGVSAFSVTGGERSSPIGCAWGAEAEGVDVQIVDGKPGDWELILDEETAGEFVSEIASRIARNGIARANVTASE